jgi:hypothetical protein
MCVPALLIRISIVENASGKEAMLETAFLSHHISKVCTSVSLKVLFKFNHSVFTSTAKDNFIIVFAKISALLYRFR